MPSHDFEANVNGSSLIACVSHGGVTHSAPEVWEWDSELSSQGDQLVAPDQQSLNAAWDSAFSRLEQVEGLRPKQSPSTQASVEEKLYNSREFNEVHAAEGVEVPMSAYEDVPAGAVGESLITFFTDEEAQIAEPEVLTEAQRQAEIIKVLLQVNRGSKYATVEAKVAYLEEEIRRLQNIPLANIRSWYTGVAEPLDILLGHLEGNIDAWIQASLQETQRILDAQTVHH